MKPVWELKTQDYDVKSYQVSIGNQVIGWVDIEYEDRRVLSYAAIAENSNEIKYCRSRAECTKYLVNMHKST